MNADAWARELPGESLSPVLAARALLVEDPVGSPLSGETLALPHYVGLHQSVLRLPATWAAIRRSVSGADLVLVKVPGVLGTLATLAARRRGIPVAAEVVGDAEGVLRSGALGTAGRLLRPVVGVVTRFVVRRAGAVRYVTERELQRRYPPAPDAAVASFSDVVIADEPSWEGAEGGAPHLVSVGSVDQLYKGHHHLIEALGRIRDEFPNATLTIVGSGRRMPFLYETAREHGVSDAVRFTGYLGDPADVAAVLAEATLFVLPSLTEGMPRALIEAMAIGVPAIASRVGGVPELLPSSATFAPGDVTAMTRLLRELLRSPERRRELSTAGITATRRFSSSARAAALADWQRTLIGLADGG
ncbi:glycosyltransferase [Microbacterium sp. UMB0228]|uniref:glycosyltransferase n=1 Tax=Microbacterium sp. UMB0228 TaxID=2029109 RepID=UPI0015E0F293|nr:glycosyltransferase [Microbacterium sp. UMB0228]